MRGLRQRQGSRPVALLYLVQFASFLSLSHFHFQLFTLRNPRHGTHRIIFSFCRLRFLQYCLAGQIRSLRSYISFHIPFTLITLSPFFTSWFSLVFHRLFRTEVI